MIVCYETKQCIFKNYQEAYITFEENRYNFNNCTLVRSVQHFLIQECGRNAVHNAEPVTNAKWAEAQSYHDWFGLCTDTCSNVS